MSRLHSFGYYVPVTSFPNEPIDTSIFTSETSIGLKWGQGSAFEYSAKLRYNDDLSGLQLVLANNDAPLPKRRVMLEASCKVEQSDLTIGPYLHGENEIATDILKVADRVSWLVKTQLPKTYIGQSQPPTRTYDYAFDEIKLLRMQ